MSKISSLFRQSDAERPPLRIGVICDELGVTSANRAVLQDLLGANFLEVVCVIEAKNPLLRKPLRSSGSLVWPIYRWLDRRNRFEDDPFAMAYWQDLAGDRPRVLLAELESGDADFVRQRMEPFSLDVIVDLANGMPMRRLHAAARHGVWSLMHGAQFPERHGPPMFWELYTNQPDAVTYLRAIVSADRGLVLARSVFRTQPDVSLANNQASIAWDSTYMVLQRLHGLHRDGWAALRQSASLYDLDELRVEPVRPPTLWQMIRWLGRIGARSIGSRLSAPVRSPDWIIALRRASAEPLDMFRLVNLDGFREATAPDGHFWADPILFVHESDTYLFFEDFDRSKGFASIACGRVTDDGELLNVKVCLDTGFHLSFPYVFAANGETYMIPESSVSNTVDLYRAKNFPFEWEHVRVLYRGRAVDTVAWEQEGRWWFITSLSDRGAQYPFQALFSAASLHDEWEHHPSSPISTDVRLERSAGPLLRIGRRTIRPVQDGLARYGNAVQMQEITTLNQQRFVARPWARIEPIWKVGLLATHTYSTAGSWEAIDGLSLNRE